MSNEAKQVTQGVFADKYSFYQPPKPVGAWILDPGNTIHTEIHVYSKPTDEQIKNTEVMFGWKWKDFHENHN